MYYTKGSFCVVPIKNLKGINPYAQVLYMWLCHHANQEGICFPSIATLAEECGMSPDTVTKYTDELVNMGLLKKQHQKVNDEFRSNIYQLLVIGETGVAAENGKVAAVSGKGVAAENGTNYNQDINYNHLNIIPPLLTAKCKKGKADLNYSQEFEDAFAIYPHRPGDGDEKDKLDAWSKWSCIVKKRTKTDEILITDAVLLACAQNYAEECAALNREDEYHYKITNFYGKAAYYKKYLLKKPIKINNQTNGKHRQTAAEHHAAVCKLLNSL